MCSVYLPHCNHFSFDLKDLQDLSDQLPSPFILMGNVNGNHILWECEKVNKREKQLEYLILENDLIILNTSRTYFHPASDTLSSIDLKEGHFYLTHLTHQYTRMNECLTRTQHKTKSATGC